MGHYKALYKSTYTSLYFTMVLATQSPCLRPVPAATKPFILIMTSFVTVWAVGTGYRCTDILPRSNI